LSKREKNILNKDLEIHNFRSMLPYYKSTLHDIFQHVAEGPDKKYFVLAGKGDRADVFDMLIVVNCLRHGRETGM